jgi:hypothetical protein
MATLKGDNGRITSSHTAQTLQDLEKWDYDAYCIRHGQLLTLLANRWGIKDVVLKAPAGGMYWLLREC